MKLILAVTMSFMAFNAFAGESTVESTIREIETERNVRCDFERNSFSFCVGTPREAATCRYSKTYSCFGAESFKLKLKVKDYYNWGTNSRETVVTDVSYL
jgi:hypothetical protein